MNSSAAGSPGQTSLDNKIFTTRQAEEYGAKSKACVLKLTTIWQELELPSEEQQLELERTYKEAKEVWDSAVAKAERQKQEATAAIEGYLGEIAVIKKQLEDGTGSNDSDVARYLKDGKSKSLKTLYDDVKGRHHYWQERKAQRLAQYNELQGEIRLLHKIMGMEEPMQSSPPNITKANIEYLGLELRNLQARRERLDEEMQSLMEQMDDKCIELGEDAKAAAQEVHPSLMYIRDNDCQKLLKDVCKLAGRDVRDNGTGFGQLDLSDETFAGLKRKLKELTDLKAQRQAHAQELMGILTSLWEAMGIPEEHIDRRHYATMMGCNSSVRLHTKSLEKCMYEVRRLEEAKVAQMVDLVREKEQELLALCAATHIDPPEGLARCVEEISREGTIPQPGAVANLLAKLVRMLAEVQVVAAKREAIIQKITEAEEGWKEKGWLVEYDRDTNRYKGRDANKKLQRAMRANKLKERLPQLVADTWNALEEWKDMEGSPFLYDGRDYQEAVLLQMQQELQMAAEQKPQPKRQSLAPGSVSKGPSRPPSAVGNRTPMPKALSNPRALQERHSIAVIRSSPSSWGPNPEAQVLTRSGHLTLPRTPSTKGVPSPVSQSYSSISMLAATAATSSSDSNNGHHTPGSGGAGRHLQASKSMSAVGSSPGVGRAGAGTSGIKAARGTAGASSVSTPASRWAGTGAASKAAGRASGTTKLLSDILNGDNAMHTVATLGSSRPSATSQPEEPKTPPSDVFQSFPDQDGLFQTPFSHPPGMDSGSSKQWGDKSPVLSPARILYS